MRNFKILFVCGLLLFSAVALAQEEGDGGGEEVPVPEEEEPQPEAPAEEPAAEPIPDDTADAGTFFKLFRTTKSVLSKHRDSV